MCLLKVNTGCREQEVCQLRWDWFDKTTYQGLWFFALPLEIVKNRDHVDEGRPVVLNDIAKEVIRKQIENDSEWVFPHPVTEQPIKQMNCTAYQTARERAKDTLRYQDDEHSRTQAYLWCTLEGCWSFKG